MRSREFGVLFGHSKMYIDGHGALLETQQLEKEFEVAQIDNR